MLNRQELGSMTAKGGFINEADICEKFLNFHKDENAQNWLRAMGYDIQNIQNLVAIQIPVRISRQRALELGISEESFEDTIRFKKADIQIRVEIVIDNVLHVENISLKKANIKAGFNQVDKRPVTTYKNIWEFDDNIAKWLKAFTGELSPSEVLKDVENIRDNRRLFIDEIPQNETLQIFEFFEQNKYLVISDILKGRGGFSVEWFLVTRKNTDNSVDWVLKDINSVCNFYSQGNVGLTPRGSFKIGRVKVQRKGGTPDPASLQFKINPLDLFDA